ncbi:hypothetical protein ACFSQP_08310 [Bizionia sediminis]|uniref:DUF4843 domain-containing protein n=1 Tax=Bizionia sediminis TaxID=1737064 RepID=A0ABW5KS31_9FLAO
MKKFKTIFTVVILSLLTVSCIVDDEVDQDFSQSPYIVGFAGKKALVSYFEDIGPVEQGYNVNIIGGNAGRATTGDLLVNYVVDTEASTATEGQEFDFVDTSGVLRIPAGADFATFPLIVNTGGLDPDMPTILRLKLTSVQGNGVVSSLNNVLDITFVGCQSDHAGEYFSNEVPNDGLATITQLAPNTYEVSALPFLTSGGNKIPFTFENICGDITITGIPFSNLIIGSGSYDETTGVLSFNYTIYSGGSVSDGVLFDFSSPADTAFYAPIP